MNTNRIVIAILLTVLPALSQAAPFPDRIPLPDGFQPEGIAIGDGTTAYAGSLADGTIYAADLRTGEGFRLVGPQPGRMAVGMAFDQRTGALFVAGGAFGAAYVYDSTDGSTLAVYQFTDDGGTFVNDVVVTRDAAWFTDSFRPYLYRVPLGPHGQLPDAADISEVLLRGDFDFRPGEFNANGIEAPPDGKSLIVVNSFYGTLYRVDPASGNAVEIDLGASFLPSGDGLLLEGKTLYVVQNFYNRVAVVRLGESTGKLLGSIADPAFRIPTTVAALGATLYLVNARFDTPPEPDTAYEIVAVPKKP